MGKGDKEKETEKDTLRDALVEGVKEIQSKIILVNGLESISLENHDIKVQKNEIESKIDELLNSIVTANKNIKLKEDKKKKNSRRQSSSVKADTNTKIMKRASVSVKDKMMNAASEPTDGKLSFEVDIENDCRICQGQKRKKKTCVAEHGDLNEVVNMAQYNVCTSFSDIWKMKQVEKINVVNDFCFNLFGVCESQYVNEVQNLVREGVIVSDDCISSKMKDYKIKRSYSITHKGVQYEKRLTTTDVLKPDDVHLSAFLTKEFVERTVSKSKITTVKEYSTSKDSYRITFSEPNMKTILNSTTPLDGRKVKIVKNAFLILRLVVQEKNKVQTKFIEPAYIRFDAKKEKETGDKSKATKNDKKFIDEINQESNEARLYWCFFKARMTDEEFQESEIARENFERQLAEKKKIPYQPDKRDDEKKREYLKGILVRPEELYKVVKLFAEEYSLLDPEVHDESEIYEARDRHISIKLRIVPDELKLVEIKEYQNRDTTFLCAKNIAEVKEDPNGFVRYKSKNDAKDLTKLCYSKIFKMISLNGTYTLTKTRLERVENNETIYETIYGPNMETIVKHVLVNDKMIPEKPKTEGKKGKKAEVEVESGIEKIDRLKEIVLVPVEKLEYFVRINYCVEKFDLRKNDFEFAYEDSFILFEENKLVNVGIQDIGVTVSDLKPDKTERNYKVIKGTYELIVTDAESGEEKIQANLEEGISKLIGKTEIGRNTKKDILKTALYDASGDMILDLEQKTDFLFEREDFKKIPDQLKKVDIHDPSIPSTITRVTFDGISIHENATTVTKTRIVMIGDTSGFKIVVREPNIYSILLCRKKMSGTEGWLEISNTYSEEIINNSFLNNNGNIELLSKTDQNDHEKTCSFYNFGRFGIMSEIELFEFAMNENNEPEFTLKEKRYEAKLVQLRCPACKFGNIAINNCDFPSDACALTRYNEKISPQDFLLALDKLRDSTILYRTEHMRTVSLSRFKHRIQRDMLVRAEN